MPENANNRIGGQQIVVSELDIDRIKAELIQYLQSQNAINDYKYTGSAINTVLDAFAYVTHYNAFNANLAVNESFLDSAQIRSSVVSHAKLLGYLPRSVQPARATVNIRVISPNNVKIQDATSGAVTYRSLTLLQGTRFSTRIGDRTLTFVPEKPAIAKLVNDGTEDYIFVERNEDTGQDEIADIVLTQGEYQVDEYIYGENSAEEFEISNLNAVISTLEVTVEHGSGDTTVDTYEYAKNFVDFTGSSSIYFLNENRRGLYQVSFGDGIVGQRPQIGSIVRLRYITTNVGEGSGASIFTLNDDIEGNTDVIITTVASASGTAPREDMKSIKFNAPLSFISQNRAVTPNDYRTIIEQNFPNIQAISVWGGENNDPPDYGRVYISIAPQGDDEVLSIEDKAKIRDQILKPKNIVSITPVFADPSYTYIDIKIFYKYNPNVTNLSETLISERVKEELRNYNNIELRKFDGVFRASNVTRLIDNADPSIINSVIRVAMVKRINPTLGAERRYDVTFSSPIFDGPQQESVIRSSPFTYLTQEVFLRDKVMTADDNKRVIQIVRIVKQEIVVVNNNVGFVNEESGTVELIGFAPEAITGDYLEIIAIPASDDIAPRRNELLNILIDRAQIVGEIDTMIAGGTFAGVGYTTTPKYDQST